MLAYVFWHRPAADVARDDYERSLARFHRSLADYPPPGFRRSLSHRFERLPWLGGGEAGYEDWYLVEGWRAIASLESGAVNGARKGPHDDVAIASAAGAGGVYGLVAGEDAALDSGERAWLDKPTGLSYAELDRLLAGIPLGEATSVWRRRLVLGPAPENCLAGARGRPLPDPLKAREARGAPVLTE